MKKWAACPIKIQGRTDSGKFSELLFAGMVFLVCALFLALAQPDVSWAAATGYCDYPSPFNSSTPTITKTIYSGGTGTLISMSAVPYDKTADYTWDFTPSPLPSWLTVSYGTSNYQATLAYDNPTVGDYTFTITVSTFPKCNVASQVTATLVVHVIAPPSYTVSPTSASTATEGVAYARQMSLTCTGSSCVDTTGGAWSASGLPSGLTINSSTGLISGTPAAGSGGALGFDYSVTVSYSLGGVVIGSGTFVLSVTPGTASLGISTIGLQQGVEGQSYTYTVTGAGGVQPYSWTASGLPSGFTIGSGSGAITGTPVSGSSGSYSVLITLTDSNGSSVNKTLSLVITAPAAVSGGMSDYCATPPFVKKDIKPNVLLMIDNSASMYDLFFPDKGSATRTPYYCYDQTYSSANSYAGYFDRSKYYSYNFAGDYFQETAAFPGACTKRSVGGSGTGILCIDLNAGPPVTATNFVASGNYLNWLTSSKFDIEKKILTGGKYDAGSGDLVAESRGCVGRRFIKEAIAGDYAEGTTPTSLGITFGVKGPPNPYNSSAPSSGGQTYIDIFNGNYTAGLCQRAIDVYTDPNSSQIDQRTSAAECLSYDQNSSDYPNKTKNVFIQTVQECWQYRSDGTVGTDAANTIKNQCPDVYDTKVCSVSNTTCDVDANCPAGESCLQGPSAIAVGNPALVCSSTYTGACYSGCTSPSNAKGFCGCVGSDCGDACIIAQHNKYCGDFGYPPVVDPTDDPSATENYGNVPALLGDLGITGQLSFPVKTLTVRLRTSAQTGLIDEFKDTIRFGVMNFQSVGSAAECSATGILKCPKVCSNDSSISCTMPQDCPPVSPPATCIAAGNEDGAKIRGYIGDPTGNHSYGIINSLDIIRADAWTPFAEGMYDAVAYFTRNTTDSSRPERINSDDFVTTTDPIQSSCQLNHVLIITDGMSTADQNSAVMSFVSSHHDTDSQQTTTASANGTVAPQYFGSNNLDDIAYYAQHSNIFDPSAAIKFSKQKITTHVVYSGSPNSTCTTNATTQVRSCTSTDETIPEVLMVHTATDGGGLYRLANDADTLEQGLRDVFFDITRNSASGTAASVLASGEGSGANIIQAVFYPARKFGDTDVRWTGRLTNLWYYVDPFFSSSAIYEDTDADHELNLTEDDLTTFYFDGTNTMAKRKADTNSDGVPDTNLTPDISFEDLSSLWEAGYQLWARSTARRIKTSTGSLLDFTTGNAATLKPYLQAADNTEASNIISYIRGDSDPTGFRPRSVTIGSDTHIWKLGDVIQSTPRIASGIKLNAYYERYFDTSYKAYTDGTADRGMVFAGANDGMLHAFKLGKLTQYTSSGFLKASLTNLDLSTPLGHEVWAFIPKNVLPYLKFIGDPGYCHLYSVDMSPYIFDASIGTQDCSESDYWNCSKYDAAATATPSKRWRTILIGGLRFGGACRISSGSCNSGNCSITSTTSCSADGDCPSGETCLSNCVKTPGVDLDGSGSVDTAAERSLGLSTYFALDITDTLDDPSQDPQLLWEFSSNDLGFSSSGPSIVRISARLDPSDPSSAADSNKNGKWFVVFGSGPTGPISTIDHQFLARSDQNLKLFIFDLKNGPGTDNANVTVKDTTIANAFAGSMINETDDLGTLNYQDDVVYVPYTKKCTSSSVICESETWTDGGVGRLVTYESLSPSDWGFTKLIDGIGPVTSASVRLYDTRKGRQWVYFGTGRYFFEQETPDDASGQRGIAGVRDLCFNHNTANQFDNPCSSSALSVSDLTDVTDVADVPANPDDVGDGWYIKFAGCTMDDGTAASCDTADYRAERQITDPLASVQGLVFFTSLKPKNSVCDPGGKSYLWAAKYDTGGEAGALLKGKAILQVSTGAIEQVDMQQAFRTHGDRVASVGDRVTSSMEGVPPVAQGLSILSSPPPVKRTMHIRER